MDDFCKEHNFLGWFETSSKEISYAKNIDKVLLGLVYDNSSY